MEQDTDGKLARWSGQLTTPLAALMRAGQESVIYALSRKQLMINASCA